MMEALVPCFPSPYTYIYSLPRTIMMDPTINKRKALNAVIVIPTYL